MQGWQGYAGNGEEEMSMWAATIEKKGIAAFEKVREAFSNEDKAAVVMLNTNLVRAGYEEGRLWVLGTYDPTWYPVYQLTPWLLIPALGVWFIFGVWSPMIGVALIAGTYVFWSSSFSYTLFKLLLRKAGYKGRVERKGVSEGFRRYREAWANRK